MKLEEFALKKEKDDASKERLAQLRERLRESESRARGAAGALAAREGVAQPRRRAALAARGGQDQARPRAARRPLPGGVASIEYETIPAIERELAEAEQAEQHPDQPRMVNEQVTERGHRRRRRGLDGHPGRPPDPGRDREAAAPRARARPAPDRAEAGGAGGGGCGAPHARRHLRPRPADRFVPVPRPDRRRQDRAGEGARRLPVRRREGDGAHRHERVRREVLRLAARRRPSRLRRLRAGRPADRGRAPAAVLGDPARRGREGASGGLRRAAAGARRRPADRRPGPHGRLPQRHPGAHLEPGQPVPGRPDAERDREGGGGAADGAPGVQAGVREPPRRHRGVLDARPRRSSARSSSCTSTG